MLTYAALISLGSAVASYPNSLHQHLDRAAPAWLDQYQPVVKATVRDVVVGVVELGIRGDGTVDRLGLAHSSGNNAADDLLRMYILAAEPMPMPKEADLTDGRRATCL